MELVMPSFFCGVVTLNVTCLDFISLNKEANCVCGKVCRRLLSFNKNDQTESNVHEAPELLIVSHDLPQQETYHWLFKDM